MFFYQFYPIQCQGRGNPENDEMAKRNVKIRACTVGFGQNEYMYRVLRLKQPGRSSRRHFDAAKFGIFDFFQLFLVIFGYSLALNV